MYSLEVFEVLQLISSESYFVPKLLTRLARSYRHTYFKVPLMPKKYETPAERHAARLISKRKHYTRYTDIFN